MVWRSSLCPPRQKPLVYILLSFFAGYDMIQLLPVGCVSAYFLLLDTFNSFWNSKNGIPMEIIADFSYNKYNFVRNHIIQCKKKWRFTLSTDSFFIRYCKDASFIETSAVLLLHLFSRVYRKFDLKTKKNETENQHSTIIT